MTHLRTMLLAAAAAALLDTNESRAALIDQGMMTLDDATGLQWLDVTETVNLSADDIVGGAGGFAADGWVHATTAQVETLLLNAGMVGPFDGTQSPGSFAGANLIISLLGSTGAFGNSISIQAFSATTGTFAGSLATPVVITSFGTVGGADVPGPSVPSVVAAQTIGNYLVRGAITAPEPPAVLLMVIGLVGMACARRRRR